MFSRAREHANINKDGTRSSVLAPSPIRGAPTALELPLPPPTQLPATAKSSVPFSLLTSKNGTTASAQAAAATMHPRHFMEALAVSSKSPHYGNNQNQNPLLNWRRGGTPKATAAAVATTATTGIPLLPPLQQRQQQAMTTVTRGDNGGDVDGSGIAAVAVAPSFTLSLPPPLPPPPPPPPLLPSFSSGAIQLQQRPSRQRHGKLVQQEGEGGRRSASASATTIGHLSTQPLSLPRTKMMTMTSAVMAVDSNWDACKELKWKYSVVPGRSWGVLTRRQQVSRKLDSVEWSTIRPL